MCGHVQAAGRRRGSSADEQPEKVEILTEAGINIVERVPLIVGRNPKNAHYLDTKAAKMGHLLKRVKVKSPA